MYTVHRNDKRRTCCRVRVCEAEVVDRIEGEEVEEELVPLLVTAHERRPFVQGPTEAGVGEQRSQMPREQFLLQRQPDERSCVPNMCLNISHGKNISETNDEGVGYGRAG